MPRPAETAADRTVVVMNAGSGRKGSDGKADAVAAFVAERPGRAELRLVRRGGDLGAEVEAAMAGPADTIVAAGGDGTIAGVAARLAGSGRRLGVLPLGTFNYFARGLGIPEAVGDALAVLDHGAVRELPVGRVNGRLFLNNASVGIYPRILAGREAVYSRWGRSRVAAYWSVLRTVAGFRHARRMKVTVDGRTLRAHTPLVFVALNPYQLELFGLEGADRVRAGDFAVYVAPDCGRAGLLGFALKLVLRGMRRGRDFELLHGREVVIDVADGGRADRRVAIDGELVRIAAPLELRVEDAALHVLVPAAAEAPA